MLCDAGLDPAGYANYTIKSPGGSSPEHDPLHVDPHADNREREIERLVAEGATVAETKTAGDRTWTVMRDPDANPFCVE